MSRGRNAAWQLPTPEQRELLRVVLLADFPNRNAIATHLDEIRVQPDFARSSGIYEFRLPTRLELEPQEWPVFLSGASTTGIQALVLLFARDGRDFQIEIAPFDDGAFGRIIPATITEPESES